LRYAKDPEFRNFIDRNVNPSPVNFNVKKIKKDQELEHFTKIGILKAKSMFDIEILRVVDDIFQTKTPGKMKKEVINALKAGVVDNEEMPETLTELIAYPYSVYDADNDETTVTLSDVIDVNVTVRDEIVNGVKNFETLDKETIDVSEIPIYMVVLVGGIKNAIHMSIVVIYNNEQYTVGLGYYGANDKQSTANYLASKYGIPTAFFHLGISSLYSPDYLLHLDNEYRNKVIGAGILTSDHLEKINKFAKEYNKLNIDYTSSAESKFNVDEEGAYEHRYKNDFKAYYVGSNREYSTTCTKGLKGYSNCTTFVEDIFPEIECGMIMGKGIVHPRNCKSSPPLTPEKLRKINAALINGNSQELLQLLA
jgi:hypothetical protein